MADWLADRIAERARPSDGLSEKAIQEMRQAPRVAVDDVFEFYFAGTDKEFWGMNDFPFLLPPFDAVWIESRTRPTAVVSRVHGQVDAHRLPTAVSVLVRRFTIGKDRRNTISKEWADVQTVFVEGSEHVILLMAFAEYGFTRQLYVGSRAVVVDHLGHHLPQGDDVTFVSVSDEFARESPMEARVGYLDGTLIQPAMLALSFLNVRNARTDEVQVDRSYKKREMRHGRATSRYYVLTIDVLRRAVDMRANESGLSIQRALHICRGHFATYGDDHPLFGKYTGKYWIPAHIRGSAGKGVVIKDYELRAVKS